MALQITEGQSDFTEIAQHRGSGGQVESGVKPPHSTLFSGVPVENLPKSVENLSKSVENLWIPCGKLVDPI